MTSHHFFQALANLLGSHLKAINATYEAILFCRRKQTKLANILMTAVENPLELTHTVSVNQFRNGILHSSLLWTTSVVPTRNKECSLKEMQNSTVPRPHTKLQ